MTPHPNDRAMSRTVKRDSVPDEGLEIEIEATPQEREALAGRLGIPAVERLEAHLAVTRWRGRGLAVKGHVEARVEQTCVVTLDPVVNPLNEDIEVYFAPEGAAPSSRRPESGLEADEKDIEELVGERIDVGELVAEHVALGLDPYPRRPDAVFDLDDTAPQEAEKGAFAALSVLRGGRSEK
jgi:uncharacterized metal-binding protein YceD (DUF177 family)